MLSKSFAEISVQDLQNFVAEHPPENDQLEFKETLPAPKGLKSDPWLLGENRIGDRARNEVLEEIVAFANAHGGTLLLGISQSEEKPHRAEKICPIPKCHDLAERLRHQCRDCIEPQILMIEIVGLETDKDGAGVVLMRVPRSGLAPHRHTITKECYHRRADRSEKMTMREIQDLVLQAERGQEAINKKFEARRKGFRETFSGWLHVNVQAFAAHVCLVPLDSIFLEEVHRSSVLDGIRRKFSAKSGHHPFEMPFPFTPINRRPLLRGTTKFEKDDDRYIGATAWSDGTIEFRLTLKAREEHGNLMYPGWFMGMAANGLIAAEAFRQTCGAVATPYGMEAAIQVFGEPLKILSYSGSGHWDVAGELGVGATEFPRYGVADKASFQDVLATFERDFWHATGRDWDDRLEVMI